jgi:hypothetical protein
MSEPQWSPPTFYIPPESVRRMNRMMRREHKRLVRWTRRHQDTSSPWYWEPDLIQIPKD